MPTYDGTTIDIIGTACLPYGKPAEYLHATLHLRGGLESEVIEKACQSACEDAQRTWGFSALRAERWHHAGQTGRTVIYTHP